MSKMKCSDWVGKRAGKLVVEEWLPDSNLRCRCDCGNERLVRVGHFNTGKIKSCGCHVQRHGHSTASGNRSREYVSYHNMIARCHRQTNKRFKDYGGKGIVVCDRWRRSFYNFISDMGNCPPGYQIDRIDNRKPYEPENCRWASRKVNQRNRGNSLRWVVNGITYETADDAGTANRVSSATVRQWCLGRIAAGRWYAPKQDCGVTRLYV